MYTRKNNLENLDLDLEHDSGYETDDQLLAEEYRAMADIADKQKIVLCGDNYQGGMTGVYYVYVEPLYSGQLSEGQTELYNILLILQRASIYASSTFGLLARLMMLENPLAVAQRFDHLCSLGAIRAIKTAQ